MIRAHNLNNMQPATYSVAMQSAICNLVTCRMQFGAFWISFVEFFSFRCSAELLDCCFSIVDCELPHPILFLHFSFIFPSSFFLFLASSFLLYLSLIPPSYFLALPSAPLGRNYNAMVLNVPGAQQVETRTGVLKQEAMLSSSC